MKALFIHAKSKLDVIPLVRDVKFKGRLGLVTTVQHLHTLKDVQKALPGSVIGGQILGCDVSAAEKIRGKVDAFLFIGSGRFHPLQVAYATGKDAYCVDLYTGAIYIIGPKDVEQWQARTRGAFLKFLNAKRIGILVSTKPGQNKIKDAESFRKETDKEAFIFLFDTLDFNGLENFPDVDCWINTACPRIVYDDNNRFAKPVINLEDLRRLLS